MHWGDIRLSVTSHVSMCLNRTVDNSLIQIADVGSFCQFIFILQDDVCKMHQSPQFLKVKPPIFDHLIDAIGNFH